MTLQVIESASGLLAPSPPGPGPGKGVEHLLLEYSPGIFERRKLIRSLCLLPAMLAQLLGQGYRIAHLPAWAFATPWPPR